MTDHHLLVEDQPAEQDLAFLEDQINRYNIAQVSVFDARRLAIFVRDEQQAMLAGISGYTWAGMCEIQFLWVVAALRGQGYGGRLLEAAEQEARDRGCQIIVLNSYRLLAFTSSAAIAWSVRSTTVRLITATIISKKCFNPLREVSSC
jgi:GNAT superfamily N-acetyltransferase